MGKRLESPQGSLTDGCSLVALESTDLIVVRIGGPPQGPCKVLVPRVFFASGSHPDTSSS